MNHAPTLNFSSFSADSCGISQKFEPFAANHGVGLKCETTMFELAAEVSLESPRHEAEPDSEGEPEDPELDPPDVDGGNTLPVPLLEPE